MTARRGAWRRVAPPGEWNPNDENCQAGRLANQDEWWFVLVRRAGTRPLSIRLRPASFLRSSLSQSALFASVATLKKTSGVWSVLSHAVPSFASIHSYYALQTSPQDRIMHCNPSVCLSVRFVRSDSKNRNETHCWEKRQTKLFQN